ncbi:hypothetical protein TSUD_357470 [Trifolium subterraneum]|uniref:F-box domain-containing protein n=1 Tax=Trifolium subterraneum TaxID=3900 RepID=A0A2Z6MAA1_TRISU|nr:hypothetical protein TSUD_357470 [Trifolium subterraneum]
MERPKRQREDNKNEDMISEERHKRQHKDNQNEDMISHLSDCLLLHILSFLKTKQAVQTCVLSKRWINLWKTLPTLSLRLFDFRSYFFFREFVSQVLSLRNDSTAICALHLYKCHGQLGINLFQRTIKYAVSHNVKHLQLDVPTFEYFPSCFFSCLTLTSLNLSAYYNTLFHLAQPQIFPNSLKLPALTTLSLEFFAFRCSDDGCVEPFSAFNMLNTLIVRSCVVLDGQNLRISSTKLVNLTIHMYRGCHFKNFGRFSFRIELYYAPSLHTFAFIGNVYIHKLSGSKSVLASIKHASIDLLGIPGFGRKNPAILLNWLIELANIDSLTITPPTLKILILDCLGSFPLS